MGTTDWQNDPRGKVTSWGHWGSQGSIRDDPSRPASYQVSQIIRKKQKTRKKPRKEFTKMLLIDLMVEELKEVFLLFLTLHMIALVSIYSFK